MGESTRNERSVSSLPSSLTSPPRACRVLIIPGVAVFYFETKRGLLMGIQLKPAANICFDAAAVAAAAAAAAGAAGGGPGARVNHAAGMRGVAGRSDQRPPARGPRRASPQPRRAAGAAPAARAALVLPAGRTPSCAGPLVPRPFDQDRGTVGSPQQGLEVTGQGQGGTGTAGSLGYTHSAIPHVFI